MPTSYDAIVVGGGCAGLSAATALSERGARVLVLEARPTLGGRATAYRDPQTGEPVDNGQHILMGCYGETLSFLQRIGASNRVRWQTGLSLAMIDRQGHASTFRLPVAPSPLHLLGGVLAWDALDWAERWSVLRLGAVVIGNSRGPKSAMGDSPPAETVREWLNHQGQAPRLCELLWEPLAIAALNQSIDVAAADHFVKVLQLMFGPDASAASLILPAVPLDDLYATPSRNWLEAHGSEVRLGAKARVATSGDRVIGVQVHDELVEAPTVISAVPWFAMSSLFADAPSCLDATIHNASRLGSSPIVTVNLWLDRPVIDAPLVGLPGRTFQWVFDKRQVFGEKASHLSLVSSGAAAIVDYTNDQLIALAVEELQTALPIARTARIQRASAVRERRATFSLSPDAAPRPSTITLLEGFFLAGDWIDTGLPATIESAVVSGHRAAAMIS